MYALRAIAASLLVSACSFSAPATPTDGGVDAADLLDGPPADSDRDGDGVVDSVDNCADLANPGQEDYDADSHGDACDGCPHLPSAADPDGDHDGVGDACDPSPSTAGDERVLWEPFDDAAALGGWRNGTGKLFVVAAGFARQGDAANGDAYVESPFSLTGAYVATRVVVRTFNATSTGVAAGICVSAGSGTYACCTVERAGAGAIASASSSAATPQRVAGAVPLATYGTGDAFEIVQDLRTQNACTVSQGTHRTMQTVSPAASTGKVELYTSNGAADFDYLFVVKPAAI